MPSTAAPAIRPQTDPTGCWADHDAHLRALDRAVDRLAATHQHPAAASLRQHLASALVCWQIGSHPQETTSHAAHRADPSTETETNADPIGVRDACSRLATAIAATHMGAGRPIVDTAHVWAAETVTHLVRASYHAQQLARLP